MRRREALGAGGTSGIAFTTTSRAYGVGFALSPSYRLSRRHNNKY